MHIDSHVRRKQGRHGMEEDEHTQKALALLKIIQLSEADVRTGRTIPQEDVFRRIEAVIDEARRGQDEKTV
jgi:hypothetical protein